MRNSLYLGVALAVLTVLAAPAAAQQQNEQTSVELDTINVEGAAGTGASATGDEQPTVATKAKTPLKTRASRQELDRKQISEPGDISRITPGVSYSSQSGSFNVRGLDRARVLTTIDGVRIPWLDSGSRGLTGGSASFDFDMLSQIDLLKSADSTVFGSGALGGVVAVRTLEPEDLIEPGNTFGGLTRGRFDSRDNSWTADQALAGRVDNTFIMVQGGYRDGHETDNKGDVGGYGVTRTERDPSDYTQESLLVKLKQHVDGGHVFGITGERFDRDEEIHALSAPVTGSPSYTPGTAWRTDVNKRDRISANYSYDGGGFLDAADMVMYWQQQEIENGFDAYRAVNPVGPFSRTTTVNETIYGTTGSALKIFDTGTIEHQVSFGGELFASETSEYSAGYDACVSHAFPPCSTLHTNQADMPDVEGTTLGLFIQDQIGFLDNRVRVIPGIRYDWYEFGPVSTPEYLANPNSGGALPPSSSDDAISGKLRIEADAVNGVMVYGQWAQAFRQPTATELYLDYGSPGTYLIRGNENLKPETSNGFEIGMRTGDSDFGGGVSAFYNRYKNFIDDEASPDFNPIYPWGVTEYINRANVEIYGAELSAHYRDESGWHTWGQIGAYVGRDIDENLHLNSIPAAKMVLGVGYAADEWGTDLIFTAAAARDENDVENEDSATPSYQLLDLTAWWSPRQLKGFTLRAGVYNIFDELHYEDAFDLPPQNPSNPRPPQEYFSEPGRNYRVTATYKF